MTTMRHHHDEHHPPRPLGFTIVPRRPLGFAIVPSLLLSVFPFCFLILFCSFFSFHATITHRPTGLPPSTHQSRTSLPFRLTSHPISNPHPISQQSLTQSPTQSLPNLLPMRMLMMMMTMTMTTATTTTKVTLADTVILQRHAYHTRSDVKGLAGKFWAPTLVRAASFYAPFSAGSLRFHTPLSR